MAKLQEEKEVEPLDPSVSAEDLVKAAVCQFADLPYEEQLAKKRAEIEALMENLRKEFMRQASRIL
jgi:tRNA/tmRNA/rRNA uracil-C5-methylase (TrmA/RlmC/RlmD family)